MPRAHLFAAPALQEDKPALQARIASLEASRLVLKKEKKRLKAEYAALKSKLRKQAADIDAHNAKYPLGPGQGLAEVGDLQARLEETTNRQAHIAATLNEIRSKLGTARPEERQILESQLVVLQVRRRFVWFISHVLPLLERKRLGVVFRLDWWTELIECTASPPGAEIQQAAGAFLQSLLFATCLWERFCGAESVNIKVLQMHFSH